MDRKQARGILVAGMLVCFAGAIYSYIVNYTLGVYLNGGILGLLYLRWLFMRD